MTIQLFKPGEEKEIRILIQKVFDEFVGPEYSVRGNLHFYEFIEEKALRDRFSKVGNHMWTAKENGKIVGVIAIRNRNHLALLFVEKEQQGKGIGQAMLDHVISYLQAREGCRIFTVNSSLYAEPIYRKWGFESTKGIQELEGIKFIPMRLVTSSKSG